jgi:uncharacterized protein (TIGR02421 family)
VGHVRDLGLIKRELARISPLLKDSAKGTTILSSIAWPLNVEDRFFAERAEKLPVVSYEVDAHAANERIAALQRLEKSVLVDGDIGAWLTQSIRSFIDGNRLLLALGTQDFYRLSRELYGGSRTESWEGGAKNFALAEHILSRLEGHHYDQAQDQSATPMRDEAFARAIMARLDAREPRMQVEVQITPQLAAKIQAGRTRVRIRRGAEFQPWELDNLWSHEVETHALCAQNGALQPHAAFLAAGGPRSTRTQEGLATFAELYDHDLGASRMVQLATRVKLVAMAEDGASFLDLYRDGLSRGVTPRDAYFDAQRVCRGGLVTGGAPFTKDVVYLSGLLEVYAFLATVVRAGSRDEAEMLVCGRTSLDDMPALVRLRQLGLLERPKFLPRWLSNWRGLVPYFAFTSFVGALDLSAVERKWQRVIDLVEAENLSGPYTLE